jgi:hypothetical protein
MVFPAKNSSQKFKTHEIVKKKKERKERSAGKYQTEKSRVFSKLSPSGLLSVAAQS